MSQLPPKSGYHLAIFSPRDGTKKIKLSNHTINLTLNLKKVDEIADDLHDREDADADSDVGDTGLHVII